MVRQPGGTNLSPVLQSLPADALALFQEFLAALSVPEGGEALYRLHAPTAVIRDGERLRPASDVVAERFADSHRDICRRDHAALPTFTCLQALSPVSVSPGAAESVAWFKVDTREQPQLFVALGVDTSGTSPRVGWCTVAQQVEAWSYRQGLLQSLSDYAWMRKVEPAQPRVLLDASYFRRYWRSPVQLSTLPDARFSCRMSGLCCRNDFEIPLVPEAQLVIDAVAWERVEPRLVGTRLPVREDGKLQLKQANEACRFLGAQRQCLLHQVIGHQPFETCAIYPYAFAKTPDGIAVALSPVCPSARQGFGLAPLAAEEDLRDRLAQAEPRTTDAYRLDPDRPIDWADFSQLEQALLSCVTASDLSMRQRLRIGARLLRAVRNNEPFRTADWLAEPVPEVTPELRTALRGMLEKILRWDRPVLQGLPPTLPDALFKLELNDAPVFARILQNMLFSKTYSYQYDLTSAFNFAITLYLLALVMQAAASGPLPDVYWQELAALGVHGLLKNMLHDGVPAGFRAVFGTGEFGQWLLAI